MSKAPPSFDFFYNDWIGGTAHLSLIDEACYLKLLIYQWQNGYIPIDPVVRQHLCSMSEDAWRAVWGRISEKFVPKELEDGTTVLINERMDVDRDEAIASWKPRKEVSDARRRAGRKGGIASGRSRSASKTPLNKGSNPRSKNEAKTKQNEAKPEGGSRKVEASFSGKEKGGVGEKGKPIYSESFERFWSLYPRAGRNRKADAMKYFSAIPGDEHEKIFTIVVDYALSEKVRDGYAMNAPNWLRDRCWEDDPESWLHSVTEPTKAKKANNSFFDED